jgi:glutamate dehydrogenase
MSHTPRERADRIAAIVRAARPTDLSNCEAFYETYYRGVDPDDLASRPPKVFADIAAAHQRFAHQRRAEQDLVQVFNPQVARDGFSSEHTVVMVACEDRPFLVDSLSMAITQAGLAIHLIVHPVLQVKRNPKGQLVSVSAAADAPAESWQYFEIDHETSPARLQLLTTTLSEVLREVRLTVSDWQAMKARLHACIHAPEHRLSAAQQEFLQWMHDDHFTFIGARDYELKAGAKVDDLVALNQTGLGILKTTSKKPRVRQFSGTTRQQLRSKKGLIITKANAWSRVHRHSHLDYVGIKRFNREGKVIGERRFLGLWTSTAYHQSLATVPLLKDTAQHIIDHFGLSAQSHDGKAISHVLETFPRDELFQASPQELIPTIRGVVNLYDRRMTRVFGRRDPFGRFWSLLIFIPRDRYNTEVRERVETTIRHSLDAIDVQSQIELSDSPLARLYLIVRGAQPPQQLDIDGLEKRLAEVILSWRDRLRVRLRSKAQAKPNQSSTQPDDWFGRYAEAFPAAYRAENTAVHACQDIESIEALRHSHERFNLSLSPSNQSNRQVSLRLTVRGEPLAISDTLPALENFGLKLVNEHPYRIATAEGDVYWVQNLNLHLSLALARSVDWDAQQGNLLTAIRAVWLNQADNDPFNRLVLAARLNWRECVLARAACRWLIQIGLPYSLPYMASVLETHADLCRHIILAFIARHNPTLSQSDRSKQLNLHAPAISQGLSTLQRLDEDRILSGVNEFLSATLRTNYFQVQATGECKPYLSLKIDPSQIKGVPEPKPRFEIWVHSPRIEGVHLRKGPVARGGLRWSDRYEDFRTEILGLVKAQHVKNTLIVPVGAKGGFVCRQLPPSRDAQAVEVKACYQEFIRGLLDVTDNIVKQKIVPPPQMVRLDADDPYLVVAADKGTATFSDTANALAQEYGFWLSDAFASGGSHGYDHKKMAITARGAWECVVRHFRELGISVGRDVIRVAGVGDMSGDVFGNGLLYSDKLALVAAFNHQHIFIDPNPNPSTSYKERQRLFNLPRSSWDDYNRKLISKGGGIYNRSEKSLNLSKEACLLLGLTANPTPNDVIKAILRLEVDLLWNGGIGTYIKASAESHLEAGDRANDAVRVNGSEIRAKVVGEGGNLGLTQLGRIEASMQGIKLNTDFIDNSAGVNCSDVEVNIKILLRLAGERKGLKLKERDKLLVAMTDDVAKLVLRNNYLQSQALSVLEQSAATQLTAHAYALSILETQGELSRGLEFLPSVSALSERAQRRQGLTRPELAVLLSYSKIWLYNHLIQSNLPEDPALSHEINRYFPSALNKRYADLMLVHPLKREIITTATVNSLINRMGPVFAIRTSEDTGHDLARVTRAYIIARDTVKMRECWGRIDALDQQIPAQTQYAMLQASTAAVAEATHWLLSFEKGVVTIADTLKRLSAPLQQLLATLAEYMDPAAISRLNASIRTYTEQGVPVALAQEIASHGWFTAGLNIVALSAKTKQPIALIARVYFALNQHLNLATLLDRIDALPCEHHWAEVARDGLREECQRLHSDLTAKVFNSNRKQHKEAVARWLTSQATAVAHLTRIIDDIEKLPTADFATLSIAIKQLRSLAESHDA